jgi:hypothetical protein
MTNALLDRAIAAGTCDFLQQSGSGAMAYAAWGLLTPGPFDEFGAIAYAGVAQLAYAAGCNWDPNQEGGTGGNTFGCVEKAPGTSNAIVRSPCPISPGEPNYLSGCANFTSGFSKIVAVREFTNANGPTVSRYEIDAINSNGDFVTLTKNQAGIEMLHTAGTKFSLYGDGDCLNGGDEEPDAYTYDYTDAETGCSLKVEMLGYAVDGANRVSPAWQITAGSDGLRANGGVISGDCNFAPTVVVPPFGGPPGGGGGGGPTYLPTPQIPDPDGGDEPWWMKALRYAIPGVVAGVTEELLEQLLNQTYPESIYRMVSVCEKDEDGEPISEAVEVPIPALKAPTAQIARLDAIVELLQAHKNFKQPICRDKPELEGQWVTTRWESDEKMVDSGRRLRKLFRYRTKSSRDLGQLSSYWASFTWRAGPVCVIHKGAWWGTPQVWAESTEEGRRVIRHAAAEAGLDPDQVGRWTTSSSGSPRYGMSGTMKILKKEGFPWVSSRDGANWPNYLALSRNP